MQIYKNPFKEAGDSIQQQATAGTIEGRVKRIFRHRPHSERHKSTHTAAVLLGYVCNTLSGLTSATAGILIIYQLLAPIHQIFAVTAAVLLSLSLVVLIEIIKRHSLKETLINAIQYKTFSFGLFLLAIVFCSVSVVSSWYGAKMLPETMTRTPKTIDVDSVRQLYDSKIQAATILHTYKPTNTLTKKGAAILSDMQTEKMQAISEAKTANESTTQTHTEQIQIDGRLFVGIAFSIELLFLLCVFFSVSYYWRCYLEIEGANIQPPTDPDGIKLETISNTTASTDGSPHHRTSNKIGFVDYENRNNENRKTKTGTRICQNCGEWYTHKHWKQKYCCTACRVEFWQLKNKRKVFAK